MAVKSSGSLSLSEIQAEFGGSNPISLSEYYAGGSLVPAGTVGYPGGAGTSAVAIPSSGSISVSNFYGSTKIPSSLSLRVLMVGGGGAGGQRGSGDNTNGNGGGGAGAVYDVTISRARGSYSFTIGQGGMSQVYGKLRTNNDGTDTIAFGFTAKGGGAGGRSDAGAGRPGGCGGGGAANFGSGGSSTQTAYGSGYNGATAGAGGGGGGGGAGSAGFTGTRFGEGGLGYTWIDDRVYGGGGASSSKATYADGGGGRGGNGLGGTNRALASVSSTITLETDYSIEVTYWALKISWGESVVYLPSNPSGFWQFRVFAGGQLIQNWTRSTGNGAYPDGTVYLAPYNGLQGPPFTSYTVDIQGCYASGSVYTSCSSDHVVTGVTISNGGYGSNGYAYPVKMTDSSYWNWNSTGSTNSDNTGNLYGPHAWFYGGGGGAGSNQGGGGTSTGGAGRNGVVIVSYEWPYQVATGGTSYKIGNRYYHRFTSDNQTFSW